MCILKKEIDLCLQIYAEDIIEKQILYEKYLKNNLNSLEEKKWILVQTNNYLFFDKNKRGEIAKSIITSFLNLNDNQQFKCQAEIFDLFGPVQMAILGVRFNSTLLVKLSFLKIVEILNSSKDFNLSKDIFLIVECGKKIDLELTSMIINNEQIDTWTKDFVYNKLNDKTLSLDFYKTKMVDYPEFGFLSEATMI